MLILAIEGAIRDLINVASGRPTISYRDGQYNSLTLGPLLRLIEEAPELKQSIGEDIYEFLNWFIGDPLGANYRNSIAHVLTDIDSLGESLASFLVWFHWKLSSYRIRPQDGNEHVND